MSARPARPNGAAAPLPPQGSVARLAASRAAIHQAMQVQAAEPPTLDRWARAHPWVLLGGAALAGAALVALRPWRWLPRPPVLASMAAQLAWQAMAARQSGRHPARTLDHRSRAGAPPPG